MASNLVDKYMNEPSISKHPWHGYLITGLLALFLFMSLGCDQLGLMNNDACFPILGCNAGFGGFDALVHLVSGASEVVIVIWLIRTWPKVNILTNTYWKNIVILSAIVLLLSFFWELSEYIGDWGRMYIWHHDLIHPNMLYQASDADTMGDMTFSFVGALISSSLLRFFRE